MLCILEKSISNNFQVLDIDLIKFERKKFHINKRIPERFINMDEVHEAANNVVISINQAQEYFKSDNNSSAMTNL